MANKILTPKTLWDKFNLNLPLNETTFFSETINNAVFNYVYFSGRNVGVSRVRIYGIYAEQKNVKSDTILILPDPSSSVDVDLISHFSNLGFNVLAVDFRGKVEGVNDYTVYPDKISYSNYAECKNSLLEVKNSVKDTCWFEWCAVARYAISYAKSKSPNSKIGVLGIKNGANIAWQVAGVDERVDSAVFISGAGWLAYQGVYKHGDLELELDDEKLKFIAGIDSHAYAQNVKCPIFLLGCANCDDFDVDRAVDTIQRVKNEGKCWFHFVNNSKSVLDLYSLKNVERFFKKFLSKDKIAFYKTPEVEIEIDGEDILYHVYCDSLDKAESVNVYASSDDINPSQRVWYNVPTSFKNDEKITFSRRVYGNVELEIAYAVIKYKNGLTLSSKFEAQKITVNSNSKIPSVIFSSSHLNSNFLVDEVRTRVIGDVFSVNNLYEYVVGPYDILGVSTKNTLLTYLIKKFANDLSNDSFIKFDAYTEVFDVIKIKLFSHDGNEYEYKVNINGNKTWQNFNLLICDFKTETGMPLKRFENVYALSVSSNGSVLVNNFLVL